MNDTMVQVSSFDDLDACELLSRSAVYRLLSRLWLRELDAATLNGLSKGPLRDAFVAAGGSLPEAVDPQSIDELAFDYCQIFVGPSQHLPPYQSVWTEGQFQGTSIASLKQYVGLLNSNQWDSVSMLDHLGIELEIMAYLLEELAAAERSKLEVADIASSFFRDHLSWPSTLCAEAGQRAQTAFYRTMIAMSDRFLASERSAL